MHSLRLDIDNSVYSQFLSFVKQFKQSEVSIIEDKVREDFVVSSVEDVQKRVANAEQNNNFTSHEEFWFDIDKKIKDL
ncbi:MAG: hypothetical protein A3E21_02355 [Sulfurimonas sp. RIFCSPHIGHO2_12_FULL_36_9]|uniref:hypothetical protein n=1 Tax=Sulfurimonas sp. RIFCSPLOWO2_12_36_12 TaxID=1802253 RepID=UPI0008B14124|nr:hypothetical protein [Sulfurimonas sp. RIFCSPLOWO2_12_36_12]OHD98023.1 MAG: hypothetical protein A3J26_08725 [Sulfurimonas sp. RIFCSPLOWO2_02_FULL_36_28]OHD99549.1 MAG: hypothetical protein A3E21_02355 [Sulfurimonas sp. RIFCSPHIGHO2_12_FULL_36_9]OHE02443.1 MAG: hypothetical protein A2W82_04250 [Sulfurimonas sp. RIFCSPLOWO2_12_36_12]OHE06787.1 MAG: hypothetical protein A3K14_02775 [Sulfurimonas sp. RIFCSPLOWO2_12_FULL_36_74]